MRSTRAALVVIALAGTIAHADPAADAAQEKDAAYQAYGVSDYDAAIVHYKTAYRLTADPRLFYNLGLSHRKRFELRGDRSDAVEARDYFRRFLELVEPADGDRERIEQTRALARTYEVEMATAIARLDARPPAPTPARRGKLWLISAGALAVAGSVTGVLALRAESDAEDANAIGDVEAVAARGRAADRYALATDVLLGGALVAGGIGLYRALSKPEASPPRTTWLVSPAGIAVRVRY
ncbi:MAG TPA: hypothetical protein VFQ53_21745 [Kofleriaceae bacterium]|nr:hypothetical protein [Kofleriaceae bacterium]